MPVHLKAPREQLHAGQVPQQDQLYMGAHQPERYESDFQCRAPSPALRVVLAGVVVSFQRLDQVSVSNFPQMPNIAGSLRCRPV